MERTRDGKDMLSTYAPPLRRVPALPLLALLQDLRDLLVERPVEGHSLWAWASRDAEAAARARYLGNARLRQTAAQGLVRAPSCALSPEP